MVLLMTMNAFEQTAYATLIDVDYIQTGDNGAVFDSETGLTWLDLNRTQSLSYNDAETFDVNYRYATNAEVETLFSQFKGANFLPIGIAPFVTEKYKELALSFSKLFGTNLGSFTYGLYSNNLGILNYAGIYTVNPNIIGTDWEVSYEKYRTVGSAYYGTYLVKIPEIKKMTVAPLTFNTITNKAVDVNEPNTLVIFILALFTFFYTKRFYRK